MNVLFWALSCRKESRKRNIQRLFKAGGGGRTSRTAWQTWQTWQTWQVGDILRDSFLVDVRRSSWEGKPESKKPFSTWRGDAHSGTTMEPQQQGLSAYELGDLGRWHRFGMVRVKEQTHRNSWTVVVDVCWCEICEIYAMQCCFAIGTSFLWTEPGSVQPRGRGNQDQPVSGMHQTLLIFHLFSYALHILDQVLSVQALMRYCGVLKSQRQICR